MSNMILTIDGSGLAATTDKNGKSLELGIVDNKISTIGGREIAGTGSQGKTYTGVYPINVDNTADTISADTVEVDLDQFAKVTDLSAKQDALVLGTGYGSTSTFDETSNYVTRHTLEVYRPVDDKDFRIYSCGFRSASGAHQSCTIKCKAYVQMWENWQEGSTVSSVNEPVAVLNYENFDMQRFGIRFDFTYLCYNGVHHFKNVDLVLDFTGSDFGAPGDIMVEMFGRKIRIPRMS